MDVGGRPLNVEMAKSLPSKSAVSSSSLQQSSLPLMMQQAVALQQMQFQQSLIMQQNLAAQQAATRAATMKSATETASARAAEISKKLKAEMPNEDKEASRKSRSPSVSRSRSKSRSRSPIKYRRSRRSRSFSPPVRYSRDRRSRTPVRSRHHTNHSFERQSHRDDRDEYSRSGRRERERSRDRYLSVSRRNRSRSKSPHKRKSSQADSASPRRRKESLSPRLRKSSRAVSKSPRRHKGNISPPRHNHATSSRHSRRSRSRSAGRRHHSTEREDKMETGKKVVDSENVGKSNRSTKDADAAAKDSRKAREDKAMLSSSISHGTASHQRRRSRSNSTDAGRHSSDGEDKSKLDKNKLDYGKSDNIILSGKDADGVMKNTRENKEDKAVDSSSNSHKRGSLASEDEALRGRKDHSKHKRSRMDDEVSEKTNSAVKDHNHGANNSDVRQDKRSANSPPSKSHRKGDSEDWSRHEKTSSKHREHEKSGTVTRERDSGDSRRPASSPTSRSHRKGPSHGVESDDRSGHEKSSSKHRRHDKSDTVTREKELEDDRRALDYSSSRSHKRSSRHLEQNYSRDTGDTSRRDKSKAEEKDTRDTSRRDKSKLDREKHERNTGDHSRRDKSKVDHEKRERDTGDPSRGDKSKVDHEKQKRAATTKESTYVNSDLGEERRKGSSELKAHRLGSLSPQRKSKSNSGFETSKVDNVEDNEVDWIAKKKTRDDTHSENVEEYADAQDEVKSDNRNPVLEEHMHFDSDKNVHSKCERSMLESEEGADIENDKKSNSVEHSGEETCNTVVEDQHYTVHSSGDFNNSQQPDNADLTTKDVNDSKHISEQHDENGTSIIPSGTMSSHASLKDPSGYRYTDVYGEHAETDDQDNVDHVSADMGVYSSPKTDPTIENHGDVECKKGGLSNGEAADFFSNSDIDHVISNDAEYAVRNETVEEEQMNLESSNKTDKIPILRCGQPQDMTSEMEQGESKQCNGFDNIS